MTRADAVARLLTPPGVGGVAVIELRGSKLLARLAFLFEPARGTLDERARMPPGSAIRGRLTHHGETIDDGLLFVWPSESRAELHLHGGRRVVQRALLAFASVGIEAEPAGQPAAFPGETLIQSILAYELAHTATARAAAWLAWQCEHGLVPACRELLASHADADAARVRIESWLTAGALASPLLEPTPVLLIGPPNAGKSSLFNAWVGREAAIVSDVPGTTRDFVDAACEVAGVPIQLYDTAGLRETEDLLEHAGVARGRQLGRLAGAWTLVLLDGAKPLPADWAELARWPADPGRTIWVRTHADQPQAGWSWPELIRLHAHVSLFDRGSLTALAGQLAEHILPAESLRPVAAAAGREIRHLLTAALNAPDPAEVLAGRC